MSSNETHYSYPCTSEPMNQAQNFQPYPACPPLPYYPAYVDNQGMCVPMHVPAIQDVEQIYAQPGLSTQIYQVPGGFSITNAGLQTYLPYQFLYTPIYPPLPKHAIEHIRNVMQQTIDKLQNMFSKSSMLQNQKLRQMMNQSNWIPLEGILEQFSNLRIGFELLQECAVQKMYRLDTNFELDVTRRLIRPTWWKASEIKLRVNYSSRTRASSKIFIAKHLVQKALASVARSSLGYEVENVEVTTFARNGDGSYTVLFNLPGIGSLIMPFLKRFSSKTVMAVEVLKIRDSFFGVVEYVVEGENESGEEG